MGTVRPPNGETEYLCEKIALIANSTIGASILTLAIVASIEATGASAMLTDTECVAGQWCHVVENSEEHQDTWQTNLEAFLNKYHPELENIHGGIASGANVHLWIMPGQNMRKMYLDKIPAEYAVNGVRQLLSDRGGVEIGFNTSKPPYMWIVTHTNPKGREQSG